jgi:hypothetical protein
LAIREKSSIFIVRYARLGFSSFAWQVIPIFFATFAVVPSPTQQSKIDCGFEAREEITVNGTENPFLPVGSSNGRSPHPSRIFGRFWLL